MRQSGLPAGPARGDLGLRRPCPLLLPHRGEQVLQGQPVLRPQQSRRTSHWNPSHSSICGFTEEDLGTLFPPELEGALASEKLLGTFDVGRIATEALLFQTGYLTVAGVETEAGREFYRLGYPEPGGAGEPEREPAGLPDGGRVAAGGAQGAAAADPAGGGTSRGWRSASGRCFSAIPHDWYRRNDIDRFEGHYASVMYAYFASLGQDVRAEESGSRGRGGPGAACGRAGIRARVQSG